MQVGRRKEAVKPGRLRIIRLENRSQFTPKWTLMVKVGKGGEQRRETDAP